MKAKLLVLLILVICSFMFSACNLDSCAISKALDSSVVCTQATGNGILQNVDKNMDYYNTNVK